MTRSILSRLTAISFSLAVVALASQASAQQVQIPPGFTMEEWNKLTPQQQELLLRQMQQALAVPPGAQTGEGSQLPESMIPQADTTLGIEQVEIDTLQFFVETPYDFGIPPTEMETGEDLELFGRRIFQLALDTFEPSTFGSVGPNYLLGPGDEIIIQMWGDYVNVYPLTINREGYVLIPKLGQIQLAYRTLAQAERQLLQFMTPSYQALKYGGEDATAFLDVTLGKLRAIKVVVAGNVVRPGSFTLSSVSTIFNALYAAGGPDNRGSLRDIRLNRGSGEITRLDGYDYVLRGDPSNDARLEDGDIIYVPIIGPKVAVQGRVQREGIFELKEGETLKEIIAATGGLSASARTDLAQITRILPPRERGETPWVRAVIDVKIGKLLSEEGIEFPLCDGDVITIFPVPEDLRDFVVVEGAVWTPGNLQWNEGLTLREAIIAAGGLREEALRSRVDVIHTNPDETTSQETPVLSSAMDGDPEENIPLQRRDLIHVYSIHDVYPREHVTIYGQVGTPGQYLLHENMTVMDLIARAGGLTKDAWTGWAEVVRMRFAGDGSVAEFETEKVPIDTSYAPGGPGSLTLEDYDQVFIRRRPHWETLRNVEVRGEVMFPGTYSLQRDDEKVSELIERTGGLSPYAYAEGARFYRERENRGRINIDLVKALSKTASRDNLVMQPGDSLYIPPEVDFVTVRGAVNYRTSVMHVRGRGPKYYVAQAGGFSADADRHRMVVTLPNGSIWQPRWLFLPDPQVEPGSEIFVPVKVETVKDAWQTIRDTTAMLSSLTTVLLLLWQISR